MYAKKKNTHMHTHARTRAHTHTNTHIIHTYIHTYIRIMSNHDTEQLFTATCDGM